MKNILIIGILFFSIQINFGQENDILKDFDYKNFIKYYNDAVSSDSNGNKKIAFKKAKYAMKHAKKIVKKGFSNKIKDKMNILKNILSKKETLLQKAQALRNSRTEQLRNMAGLHKSKKETLTAKRDEELKKVNEAKAKRKAESKQSKLIKKLPPSLMHNDKLEKEFKSLVKPELANYSIERVIFRVKDWGLNKNIHQQVVSRGMMTAFVLKDNLGKCFLQYFHFEQAAFGSNFGKTYKTKWSDKRPNALDCNALN